MSDSEEKAPDFYKKKSRLLMFIPLVILLVGGLVAGIFIIPMYVGAETNHEVVIGESRTEGTELGYQQPLPDDHVLIYDKIDQIIEEQKYQRELLEDIYDQES